MIPLIDERDLLLLVALIAMLQAVGLIDVIGWLQNILISSVI
jgi:hypothetical protein